MYIPHERLCLCCFLTVACPINAILGSFNILVFQLLRKNQTLKLAKMAVFVHFNHFIDLKITLYFGFQ